MKIASIAIAKGTRTGISLARVNGDGAPAEGSYLRYLYDLLLENRGQPVVLNEIKAGRRSSRANTAYIQLRDFYGFDIRKSGEFPGGRTWTLVGEIFDDCYISYLNSETRH